MRNGVFTEGNPLDQEVSYLAECDRLHKIPIFDVAHASKGLLGATTVVRARLCSTPEHIWYIRTADVGHVLHLGNGGVAVVACLVGLECKNAFVRVPRNLHHVLVCIFVVWDVHHMP